MLRKLYLTGGIGATGAWEGFGPAYDLPNSAYAETCASIANALWNYRMFLLEQDARYIDVYERAVYNAMLSGLSLTGERSSIRTRCCRSASTSAARGSRARAARATCRGSCCRFPATPMRCRATEVFVNLFVQGQARVTLPGGEVDLEQQTRYPWDGDVRIRRLAGEAWPIHAELRVPGWAHGPPAAGRPLPGRSRRAASRVTLRVNGLLGP